MFCSNKRDSELRLIDFGSGTLDENHSNANLQEASVDQHHTFAGSAFYISPEMFQRAYTSKTDVWSTGVTLYVLVAGYVSFGFRFSPSASKSANEPYQLIC